MKKGLLALIAIALLVSFMVANGYARNSSCVIVPNSEFTETITLTPSSSVVGNISSDIAVDFYVNSPSGSITYLCNETTFAPFSFTASEDGNYTLHIANNRTENATVALVYSKNIIVNLYATAKMTFSTETATTTSMILPPNPFNWWGFASAIGGVISAVLSGIGIIGYVKKFLEWFRWWKKYKKSRTPVVIDLVLSLLDRAGLSKIA